MTPTLCNIKHVGYPSELCMQGFKCDPMTPTHTHPAHSKLDFLAVLPAQRKIKKILCDLHVNFTFSNIHNKAAFLVNQKTIAFMTPKLRIGVVVAKRSDHNVSSISVLGRSNNKAIAILDKKPAYVFKCMCVKLNTLFAVISFILLKGNCSDMMITTTAQ